MNPLFQQNPGQTLSYDIISKVARDLNSNQGRDWEHFVTGLGTGMKERESVRLKQGEIDRLERWEEGNITRIVELSIREFMERCKRAGVTDGLGEHMACLVENEYIFDPPLRRLARDIRSLRATEKQQ